MSDARSQARSLYFTVPVGLLAVGYLAFGFWPGVRSIAERRLALEEKRSFVSRMADETLLAQAIGEQLIVTKAYVDRQQSRFVAADALTPLYGTIQSQARQSGVEIARFEPQPATGEARVDRLPVHLAVEGSFANVAGFLGRLERLNKHVWFDRLRFNAQTEAGQDIACEIELVLFADRSRNSG